jgi:AcrR family transcriptional regulator
MKRAKPQKPKQARSIKTREKIIASGKKLFCERGYYATSSKKIARHAGVATGTFYNHFVDKKALLIEIHRLHVARVHEELERLLFEEAIQRAKIIDGLSMMKKIVRLVYRTHESSPELHREINVLSLTDPDFAEMDRIERNRAHGKLAAILRPYLSRMRVKDIEAANIVVSHAMEAVIHSIIMSTPPIPRQRLLDALADMLNRYLFGSNLK